jgi:hypothetical protein
VNLEAVAEASLLGKVAILRKNLHLLKAGKVLGPVAGPFYELMTAPTTKAHDSQMETDQFSSKLRGIGTFSTFCITV